MFAVVGRWKPDPEQAQVQREVLTQRKVSSRATGPSQLRTAARTRSPSSLCSTQPKCSPNRFVETDMTARATASRATSSRSSKLMAHA
jgi:hypothetical protein